MCDVIVALKGDQEIEGKPKEDSNANLNGDKSGGDNQSGASGGKKPSIISTIRFKCSFLHQVSFNLFHVP